MTTERDELLAEIAELRELADRLPERDRSEIFATVREWLDRDDGPPADVCRLVVQAFKLDRAGNGAVA